uniref:Uncharacterized protein n=1 Tax=Taeniopygia guttata TaxID=59729 RepID=A0A674HID6_TAEGU
MSPSGEPKHPKITPGTPKITSGNPKNHTREPQNHLREPQTAPISPQHHPQARLPQVTPKLPQVTPNISPKTSPKSQKKTPMPPQNPNNCPHNPPQNIPVPPKTPSNPPKTPLKIPKSPKTPQIPPRCLHPGSPPPALDGNFWGLRDSLVQCELLLLRALRFRLPLAHPHKYLLQYLLALGRWAGGPWGRVPGVSWALLRDGAAGGLSLRHPPPHLAAAALHLGLELCGRGGAPRDPPRWWQVRGSWGGGLGGFG